MGFGERDPSLLAAHRHARAPGGVPRRAPDQSPAGCRWVLGVRASVRGLRHRGMRARGRRRVDDGRDPPRQARRRLAGRRMSGGGGGDGRPRSDDTGSVGPRRRQPLGRTLPLHRHGRAGRQPVRRDDVTPTPDQPSGGRTAGGGDRARGGPAARAGRRDGLEPAPRVGRAPVPGRGVRSRSRRHRISVAAGPRHHRALATLAPRQGRGPAGTRVRRSDVHRRPDRLRARCLRPSVVVGLPRLPPRRVRMHRLRLVDPRTACAGRDRGSGQHLRARPVRDHRGRLSRGAPVDGQGGGAQGRLHPRPQRPHRRARGGARAADAARSRTAPGDRPWRLPPRPRQDRHSRRDPQQAGPSHRRRAPRHRDASSARLRDGLGRAVAERSAPRDPPPPRATRRQRLPRRSLRQRHPPRGARRRGRRRLGCADLPAGLPRPDARPRSARPHRRLDPSVVDVLVDHLRDQGITGAAEGEAEAAWIAAQTCHEIDRVPQPA